MSPLSLKIGSSHISQTSPCYIIAEIGLNHQGDISIAKKLVDASVKAGVNCAKFQKRSLKSLYRKQVLDNVQKEEQGGQYLLNNIMKAELSNEEIIELSQYCAEKNVDFMCTPWDSESLEFLATLNPPAYKVGSPDLTNLPLLRQMVFLRKPLLISTGMSFVSEIEQVARYLNDLQAEYLFLHCNSTYPAPYADINLKFLPKLAEIGNGIVGYSGHEAGISVSLSAVALGAKVIERHITLDRTMEGPDHRASLEPEEFKELVAQIRVIEKALGEPNRQMSRGEYLNRQNLSKSLVAARNLKKGQILHESDIAVKSPGKGTNPLKLSHFVGQELIQRNIKRDEYLLESDVASRPVGFDTTKKIKTNQMWGVVARMSDISDLLGCESNFIEMHLTDSDIKKPVTNKKNFKREMVVHGPEYNADLLLDISNLDEDVRKASVAFFNKAFEHARKLKPFFLNPNEDKKFVIHPGGFFMKKPRLDLKKKLYSQLEKSLSEINTDGFIPLVENMPPLPWIFGGQWYGTSFMDAEEIVAFSKRTDYGVVFDTSHAALYCAYYNKDIYEYAKTILPVTKYLHVADASGTNGEGVQIGDGDIDFPRLMKILTKTDLWFLPEVWQGHKFKGEGFLKAIHRLKKIDPTF